MKVHKKTKWILLLYVSAVIVILIYAHGQGLEAKRNHDSLKRKHQQSIKVRAAYNQALNQSTHFKS